MGSKVYIYSKWCRSIELFYWFYALFVPFKTTVLLSCSSVTNINADMENTDILPLVVSYGYSLINPFTNISTVPVFIPLGNTTMQDNGNITTDLHQMPSGAYPVIVYPSSQGDPISWIDTGFPTTNYGNLIPNIGDNVFRSPFQ